MFWRATLIIVAGGLALSLLLALTTKRAYRSETTVVFRAGWQWAAVEGTAEICGPDDPNDRITAERLPALLRDIFIAAGGTHDDWDEYDRVMAAERRAAVLVTPLRIYGVA